MGRGGLSVSSINMFWASGGGLKLGQQGQERQKLPPLGQRSEKSLTQRNPGQAIRRTWSPALSPSAGAPLIRDQTFRQLESVRVI